MNKLLMILTFIFLLTIFTGCNSKKGCERKPFDGKTSIRQKNPYIFKQKWGSEGSDNGKFKDPIGIVVDLKGNIYITDFSTHCVQKINSEGVFVAKWGREGTGNGEFRYPYGICLDSEGNVYVVDAGNRRIQKFTPEGKFIEKLESPAGEAGEFYRPTDIAIDKHNNIYITDDYNTRKFDAIGNFITKWRGNDMTMVPGGIAISSNDYIYSIYNDSDRSDGFPGASTIHKLNNSGKLIKRWGAMGVENSLFRGVLGGIAIDLDGNIIVTCSGKNQIDIFNSDGNFITRWGSNGSGDGQFNSPAGIAVDLEGNVYIADKGNHRIQKFAPNPEFKTNN